MNHSSGEFDVVVFGATGFTGGLVAEYIDSAVANQGRALRWAVAGRDADRLRAISERSNTKPAVVVADVTDSVSLDAMCSRTRVLLTTVGPYKKYGLPVVKSAVRQGADYLDLAGEADFLRDVQACVGEGAKSRGLRVVHSCGFDSVPHDLAVWLAVRALQPAGPLTLKTFVRAEGGFSGGTWTGTLDALSRGMGALKSPLPTRSLDGRSVVELEEAMVPAPDGGWGLSLPIVDPQNICRTALTLPEYGPAFSYGHYMVLQSRVSAVLAKLGIPALMRLCRLKPAREVLKRIRPPGSGPSAAQRAKGRFSVKVYEQAGADLRKVVEVAGGDPGYGETAKMIGECALCLAWDRDRLPVATGICTPVVAFRGVLMDRLVRAGIRINGG